MRDARWRAFALRLYPKAWRERYGPEVLDLAGELADREGTSELRIATGLAIGAVREQVRRALRLVRRPVATVAAVAVVAASVCVATILSLAAPAGTTVPFKIVSGAMQPALKVDETVQVTPFKPNFSIAPGEIVVFRSPSSDACGGGSTSPYVVKRIVALPGQTISLSNGFVLINGKRLAEPWLNGADRGRTDPGPPGPSYSLSKPYRVPANTYFVLGDNRSDSCDSRYTGPIPRSLLYGAVVSHHR